MGERGKIEIVQQLQRYINANFTRAISLEDLSQSVYYNKYYLAHLFKDLTGKTVYETVKAIRLTKAAQALQNPENRVLDIALASGFGTHEGLTRAFERQFGFSPKRYRTELLAIHLFTYYPIEAYYQMKEGTFIMPKTEAFSTMTVTSVERPARKLILLRSQKARDYLSYCEEVGCDWEGLFNSIPEKFDKAALLTLPPSMTKANGSPIASGVEVPVDYAKPLPKNCEIIELPATTLLYFQGQFFDDEADYLPALESLRALREAYQPVQYGWQYAPELAPDLDFGAQPKNGARYAKAVKRIQ